jgi:hypothetical protein
VSYATVRGYVASRRPARNFGSRHADSGIRDAELMITHLKGPFAAMTPGIADEAEPATSARSWSSCAGRSRADCDFTLSNAEYLTDCGL